MPWNTACAVSAARSYFLAAKGEVIAEAEAEVASITTELQNIKNQKGIVQSKAKETENELLELVKGSPQVWGVGGRWHGGCPQLSPAHMPRCCTAHPRACPRLLLALLQLRQQLAA